MTNLIVDKIKSCTAFDTQTGEMLFILDELKDVSYKEDDVDMRCESESVQNKPFKENNDG